MTYLRRTLAWGGGFVFATLFASACQNLRTTEPPDAMSAPHVTRVFRERLSGQQRSVRPSNLASHLLDLCRRFDLDPALVLSVIYAESSFRTRAVSGAGAVGLMQLMPSTAQFIAHRHGLKFRGRLSLMDPFQNLNFGVRYLAYLRDRYDGEIPHMLAAYNLGPTRYDKLRQVAEEYTRKGGGRMAAKPHLPFVDHYVQVVRDTIPEMRAYGLSRSDAGERSGV